MPLLSARLDRGFDGELLGAEDVKGAPRNVAALADLALTPDWARIHGLRAFVRATGQSFELQPDLVTWIEISPSADAMPTSGAFRRGTFVRNSAPSIIDGRVIRGWLRLTTGNAHVLNVDWVVDDFPVGSTIPSTALFWSAGDPLMWTANDPLIWSA